MTWRKEIKIVVVCRSLNLKCVVSRDYVMSLPGHLDQGGPKGRVKTVIVRTSEPVKRNREIRNLSCRRLLHNSHKLFNDTPNSIIHKC